MKRLVLAVLVLAACSKEGSKAKADEKGPAAGEVKEPAAPPPEEESPLDKLLAKDTFAEAMQVVRPAFTDTIDEMSPGAQLLAMWAGTKLRWGDVAVDKNETSKKLITKDSDAERGKRMCISGSILEISKMNAEPKIFGGGISSGYTDIYRFLAVGSTGELVDHSRARFCGVVVGRYDYSNVGGGQTKSVLLVGMFDLPENKPAAVPPAEH